MSKERAIAFLENVAQDEGKQKEVVGKSTVDEVVAYAANQGYNFTPVELQMAQKEFYETHDIELDEDALESVAGGVVVATIVKG
jgi:predicted ribosomally synthesized peptide with nif11-like leader